MDQGVIKATQKLYCKSLLQHTLITYDYDKGYSIKLLDTIHFFSYLEKESVVMNIVIQLVYAGLFSHACAYSARR